MNEKVTAKNLIRGINNLERMRKEIDQAVNTLVGILEKRPFEVLEFTIPTKVGGYWRVCRIRGKVTMSHFSKDTDEREYAHGHKIPMKFVLKIHESLDELVATLFKEMASLKSSCAPFLEADIQLD